MTVDSDFVGDRSDRHFASDRSDRHFVGDRPDRHFVGDRSDRHFVGDRSDRHFVGDRSDRQRLLLVGGGHSHCLLLHKIAQMGIAAEVHLISAHDYAYYSGILPGAVSGMYQSSLGKIDLAKLCDHAHATFMLGHAQEIDVENKLVTTRDGREVSFDLLSINTGAMTNLDHIRVDDSSVFLTKPSESLFEAIFDAGVFGASVFGAGVAKRSLAVIGGGAAGVELALALQARTKLSHSSEKHQVWLVSSEPGFMRGFADKTRALARSKINEAGVMIVDDRLQAIEKNQLHFQSGRLLAVDAAIAATGVIAPSWTGDTGLALSSRGYLHVNRSLQSLSHEFVFAAGDIADIENIDVPKSGVFAVRAASLLYRNLTNFLARRPLVRQEFPSQALYLLNTADGKAIGEWKGIAVSGRAVMWWKNWLDQRFLHKFNS